LPWDLFKLADSVRSRALGRGGAGLEHVTNQTGHIRDVMAVVAVDVGFKHTRRRTARPKLLLEPGEEGQRLDSLPEAHVVRQEDAMAPGTPVVLEPTQPFHLVREKR